MGQRTERLKEAVRSRLPKSWTEGKTEDVADAAADGGNSQSNTPPEGQENTLTPSNSRSLACKTRVDGGADEQAPILDVGAPVAEVVHALSEIPATGLGVGATVGGMGFEPQLAGSKSRGSSTFGVPRTPNNTDTNEVSGLPNVDGAGDENESPTAVERVSNKEKIRQPVLAWLGETKSDRRPSDETLADKQIEEAEKPRRLSSSQSNSEKWFRKACEWCRSRRNGGNRGI